MEDFYVTCASAVYHGVIKVKDYKYKTFDGDVEPRNFVSYRVEYVNGKPWKITLEIPTYDTFDGFICDITPYNGKLEISKFYSDDIYDKKAFTERKCLKLAETIIDRLKKHVPPADYVVPYPFGDEYEDESDYEYIGCDKYPARRTKEKQR